MTDVNLTEIVCVLDRSGSMSAIIDDAIGGFNAMLREQQEEKEGRATMTIALFDNEYKVVAENRPVEEVEPFTRKTYKPRASTALLDAIGRTIEDTGRRFAALPEEKRPGRVLFVILTDGHENASRQYSYDQVASMIRHQTERYGWTFMYLSADVSAFDHAAQLNIGTRVQFAASALGTQSTYNIASTAARQYRKGGAQGMSIMDSCVEINQDGAVKLNVDPLGRTDGNVKVQSGESKTPDTSGAS